MPSIFIRTAGCNLRCEWCDTKYAWDASAGISIPIDSIVQRTGLYAVSHCVLTGGEPMIAEDMPALAGRLMSAGYHTTIETNATIPPNGIACDLASLSPKLSEKAGREDMIHIAREWMEDYECQFKFVVDSEGDIRKIQAFMERLGIEVSAERIFLMPQSRDVAVLREKAAMVAEICRRSGYRYGPRLHLRLFGNRRKT